MTKKHIRLRMISLMEAAAVDTIIRTNPALNTLKEKLLSLKKGTYCIHRAWGVGVVKDYDEAAGKLHIQFESETAPRVMDPAFVAAKLEVLADNHIVSRHRNSPAEIQTLIDSNPEGLFAEILKASPNHTMSLLEMEATLQYLMGENYKKWLTSAKKRIGKGSVIGVPEKKTESYILHAEPVAADDEVLVAFYKTKNVKKKIELAETLLTNGTLPEEVHAKLSSLVEELATAIVESRILTAGERLRGVWVRDDLSKLAKIDIAKYQPTPNALLKEAFSVQELSEELPSQYLRRLLELVKESNPNDWQKVTLDLLKNSSGKFTQECVSFLLDNSEDKRLAETLERWLSERSLKAPIIIWVLKNRATRRYSTMLDRLMGPNLFSAIFYAIDYEATQNASQKRIALADLLIEDRELIGELLATATPEVARDLAHTLMMSQGIETLSKRSLIARFIKQFPDIQSLIATDESTQQETLIVSWESLKARQAEYQELVTKKIPENKEAIATARELGDLKENSEYKMARQDQDTLMAQKAKTESELRQARGTDFADCPTDSVGVGSIVELSSSEGKTTYTILGAWDGNPDKNILSYKTPLAKSLLGKKAGEKVKTGGQEYTVVSFKRVVDAK